MKNLIFILAILFGYKLYSQHNNARYVNIKYEYIIDNVKEENQLINSCNEIKGLKYVDEVKYRYKPENNRAQIIVYTTQKVRQSESDDEFNIADIKEIVLKNGMMPFEFKEEIIK